MIIETMPLTFTTDGSMRAACVLAVLVACVFTPVVSQVTGVVTDLQGRPLGGATVELWRGDTRAAVRLADAVGRFSIPTDEARGASGLLVRLRGYRPLSMQLQGSAEDVAVRLVEESVALPGVTARTTSRRLCPNREMPEARLMWSAAARRYSRALDSLGVGSLFASDERSVESQGEIGPVGVGSLRIGNGVGSPAGWRTKSWQADRWGYASRLRGTGIYSEFGAWFYPLEVLPAHLASEAFAALHTFSIQWRDSAEVELVFCPRGDTLRGKPRVHGLLRLSARDTLFVSAHFEFRTSEPDEHAGAEFVFAPAVAADGRPLPVPSTELFWRQPAGSQRFYQRYREYMRWELGPTASLYLPPVIPQRIPPSP